MKSLFTALVLVSASFNSVTASAHAPAPLVAQLQVYRPHDNANFDMNVKGHVSVDVNSRMLSFVARPYAHCAGQCPQIEYQPMTLEVPIISIKQDDCGNTVITAKRDQRPVDGALHLVVLTDHSTSKCKMAYPFMTEMTSTTAFAGRGEQSESTVYFGGGFLTSTNH